MAMDVAPRSIFLPLARLLLLMVFSLSSASSSGLAAFVGPPRVSRECTRKKNSYQDGLPSYYVIAQPARERFTAYYVFDGLVCPGWRWLLAPELITYLGQRCKRHGRPAA